jgi:hypothetical protein
LKKPTGSVWFRFYKLKIEKNKPNPIWARPEKNRVKREKPSQTSLNRFWFFKKNKKFWFGYFFFINRAKLKIIIHMSTIFSPVYFSFNFSRLKWIKF